jgi:hypothetical protein
MSFGVEVAAWSQKAKAGSEAWVRSTFIALAGSLIINTPIGMPETWTRLPPPKYVPGTLRAGWVYSARGNSDYQPGAPDAEGSATLNRIIASLPKVMIGRIHYLSNAVPYFPLIEYTGYSKQAPGGVIAVTVQDFNASAQAAGLSLNGGELG